MKKKMRLMAACAAITLLLGGCGTSMYDLTEEEEGLIVQYAAYALAKHNIYQKDGMTDAKPEEAEIRETEEPEDLEKPKTEASGNAGQSFSGETKQETISLAKALGVEGKCEITKSGSSVTGSYQEGTYFTVNASEGRKLMVMAFQLKNTKNKTVSIDMSASGCSFEACFDGKNRVSEKKSFGGKILSSYSGEIKSGGTIKLYLLFEVPVETAKSHKSDDFFVTKNGITYSVR